MVNVVQWCAIRHWFQHHNGWMVVPLLQMASVNHKYDQEMISVEKDFTVSHWLCLCCGFSLLPFILLPISLPQESCKVAKDRMKSELEEKARRMKEEKIMSQMAKGKQSTSSSRPHTTDVSLLQRALQKNVSQKLQNSSYQINGRNRSLWVISSIAMSLWVTFHIPAATTIILGALYCRVLV